MGRETSEHRSIFRRLILDRVGGAEYGETISDDSLVHMSEERRLDLKLEEIQVLIRQMEPQILEQKRLLKRIRKYGYRILEPEEHSCFVSQDGFSRARRIAKKTHRRLRGVNYEELEGESLQNAEARLRIAANAENIIEGVTRINAGKLDDRIKKLDDITADLRSWVFE